MDTPLVHTGTVSDQELLTFGSRKIFFAHQSVGAGIVSGLAALPGADGPVRIVETRTPPEEAVGYFAHFPVGENGNPAGKLADFEKLLRDGFGEAAEIVLMKFCYLDVGADTDAEEVFVSYVQTMSRLQARFPGTVFVHVTMPLVTVETGPKTLAKRVLGRPVRGIEDNRNRNRFNELLRARFGKTDPVFDLAAFESTWPDGTVLTRAFRGSRFPVLIPGYASDYGHLNPEAGREAAVRLVRLLASVRR